MQGGRVGEAPMQTFGCSWKGRASFRGRFADCDHVVELVGAVEEALDGVAGIFGYIQAYFLHGLDHYGIQLPGSIPALSAVNCPLPILFRKASAI